MNSSPLEKAIKSLPPHQQVEAKQMIAELQIDELFEGVDFTAISKDIGLKLLAIVREKMLPKLRERFGAIVGIAISAMLDALEDNLRGI